MSAPLSVPLTDVSDVPPLPRQERSTKRVRTSQPLPRFTDQRRWRRAREGEPGYETGGWIRDTVKERHRADLRRARKAVSAQYGASRKVDEREKNAIAVMRAAGMRPREVGRALNLNPSTVAGQAKTPEMAAKIEQWRAVFKAQALEQAAAVQLSAWSRVSDALDRDDAKSFDQYARGIYAIERVSASAAGENRHAGVNVAVVNAGLDPAERDELLRAFRSTVAREIASPRENVTAALAECDTIDATARIT